MINIQLIPNFARHGRRQNTKRRVVLFLFLSCFVFAAASFSTTLSADVVIVEESNNVLTRGGDFECRPCMEQVNSGLSIVEGLGTNSGEVTAGELYRFFKSQGMDSVDRLVLCVDLKGNPLRSDISFDDLVLTIEDPFKSASVRNSFSLDKNGDNSLIVPGYETSSMKPEAQLEIPLGYDFMERFSENSEEVVKLNLQYAGNLQSDIPLAVYFPAERTLRWFSLPRLTLVVSFAVFWAAIFWVLVRFTLPRTQTA